MQKQSQPEYAFRYSLPGFRFRDLPLSEGHYQEVQKRARQRLEWVTQPNGLRDIALEKFALGRAFQLLALRDVEGQALVEPTAQVLGAAGHYFD